MVQDEDEEIEEVTNVEAPKGLEDDEGFESGTGTGSPSRVLSLMSPAEAILWRRKEIAKYKQKMALLCTSIMERPEERMGKLKELRMMLNLEEPRIQITVKKL